MIPKRSLPGAHGPATFVKRHGHLVQVELDALPPDMLRDLFTDSLTGWWDKSSYESALASEEADDRRELECA